MAEEESSSFVHPRSRKRASKACLACRARKVRCDISHREGSCTNCSLDQQVCIVKPRPTRYRSTKIANGAQSHPSPRVKGPTTVPSTTAQTSGSLPTSGPIEEEPLYQGITSGELLVDLDTSAGLDIANYDHASEDSARDITWGSPMQSETREEAQHLRFSNEAPSNVTCTQAQNATRINSGIHDCANTHVMSSYYPFLKIESLSQVSPEDINFLERQNCFRVPVQPALDELLREYFLHVHPSLPLINEGDFWDAYSRQDASSTDGSHISVFVFQAMLFASCSFVSQDTIRKLGFSSTRSARAAYFRRAKLLFDFNGERDSLVTAQGALLLTYNASTRQHKILNTFWLSTAIQFAKDAGAHRYHSNKGLTPERRSALKRLWWCCILRDRILPLGVRRPLNISSTDFDLNIDPPTKEDFETEIFKSRVYDASTKFSLVELLLTLCDLAVALTDVIMTVYPVNDAVIPGSSSEQKARLAINRIEACKSQLHAWFERANINFPTPAGISDTHESIILYTNLMYMYYYSALLALHHHEVLVIVTSSTLLKSHFNRMCHSRAKVEEAASGITENLKELIQLKLAKHLPISVVAYAALPLVLHVLDVKLSANESISARKRRRLDIYTMTMKGLQTQYDGTDEIFDIIGKMVDYMSLEKKPIRRRSSNNHQAEFLLPEDNDSPRLSSLEPTESPSAVKDWGDVLLRQPALYLRIALTMDLSLSKGQFPHDADFPSALQSHNHIETRFPLYRITMGDVDNAPEPTIDASDTNRNSQHPHTELACATRGSHSNNDLSTRMGSAMFSSNKFLDGMNFPITRTNGQSPLGDLELSLYLNSAGARTPNDVDALFDYSTNWADTMFLGDEWLISPEAANQ